MDGADTTKDTGFDELADLLGGSREGFKTDKNRKIDRWAADNCNTNDTMCREKGAAALKEHGQKLEKARALAKKADAKPKAVDMENDEKETKEEIDNFGVTTPVEAMEDGTLEKFIHDKFLAPNIVKYIGKD